MVSLHVMFWIMVLFFALIGALRGWSKEVIAMSGLILSLFAIKQFGFFIVRIVGSTGGDASTPADLLTSMRSQFYVLTTIHLVITFFSYQGVNLAKRLQGREGLQERLLGMIVGGINGYLVVGTLWSFLEYQVTNNGFVQLPAGFPYAFDPLLTRPVPDTPTMMLVMQSLPIPFLSGVLPILLVLVFLFVIVVII